jgi:hypothetical protein
LTIVPWPEPMIDTLGHDPRSLYVETFWLPILGPTTKPSGPIVNLSERLSPAEHRRGHQVPLHI